MNSQKTEHDRKRMRVHAFSGLLLALLALSLVAVFPIPSAHANPLTSLCRASYQAVAGSSVSASSYTFTINAGAFTSGTCDSSTWTTFNSAIIEVTTWSSAVTVVGATDSGGDTFAKAFGITNTVTTTSTGAFAT